MGLLAVVYTCAESSQLGDCPRGAGRGVASYCVTSLCAYRGTVTVSRSVGLPRAKAPLSVGVFCKEAKAPLPVGVSVKEQKNVSCLTATYSPKLGECDRLHFKHPAAATAPATEEVGPMIRVLGVNTTYFISSNRLTPFYFHGRHIIANYYRCPLRVIERKLQWQQPNPSTFSFASRDIYHLPQQKASAGGGFSLALPVQCYATETQGKHNDGDCLL